MDSKILEAGQQAQSFEKLRDTVEQLYSHIKEMKDFVAERDRLGEYDASAAAIIELSRVTLRLMEFQLVAMQAAIINFRLEN